MKNELTTAEANEIVFNNSKEELRRTLKMLTNYVDRLITLPNFNDFSAIGDLSHQVMREAYIIFGLKQSAWMESESKRPMTPLEKQLEARK